MVRAEDLHPTRARVTLARQVQTATPDLVILPPRPKRMSERAWRVLYDSDPIVLWLRATDGQLVRVRLAGPVSARAWLSYPDRYTLGAAFWDADAPERDTIPEGL